MYRKKIASFYEHKQPEYSECLETPNFNLNRVKTQMDDDSPQKTLQLPKLNLDKLTGSDEKKTKILPNRMLPKLPTICSQKNKQLRIKKHQHSQLIDFRQQYKLHNMTIDVLNE